MRVGMGYDVHRLTEGRDLILGGVKITDTVIQSAVEMKELAKQTAGQRS